MEGPSGEDPEFGVRLEWPTDETDGPVRAQPRSSTPVDAAPAPAPAVPVPTSVPLLPALAQRIEQVDGSIAALSMRFDSLVSATSSLRSVLSDRLTEYAVAVSEYANTQSADLDDYRHSTDRLLADVRKSLSENGRVVQEFRKSLDDFGDSFLKELRSLRAELDTTPAAEPQEAPDLGALRDELLDEIGLMLRNELGAAAPAAPTVSAGAEVVAALAELRDELQQGLKELRGELVNLKRRVGVRARQTLEHDVIADAVADRLGSATASLTDEQLDTLAAAVARRLEQAFEVVPGAPAEEPPPPAAAAPRRARKR